MRLVSDTFSLKADQRTCPGKEDLLDTTASRETENHLKIIRNH